jgi:rare lipoprotein A (peptidoglycan hydrolase)
MPDEFDQPAEAGGGVRMWILFGRQALRLAAIGLAGAGLSACASGHHEVASYRPANLRSYEVGGKRYTPKVDKHYDEKGLASWYNYPGQKRRPTASGEAFNAGAMAAAHKTLPLPCMVEVTNLENGKKIKVRVNDRGPYVSGRIIDLTPAAADKLGFRGKGVAKVRVKFIGPAKVADTGEVMVAEVDEHVDAPAI